MSELDPGRHSRGKGPGGGGAEVGVEAALCHFTPPLCAGLGRNQILQQSRAPGGSM